MQSKLEFNPHGVVGIVFIALLFGIAFFLQWHVNWWYFSIAALLYSIAIMSMTNTEVDFRWLLGCHLMLLFWAVGLLLHFQDYHYPTGCATCTASRHRDPISHHRNPMNETASYLSGS
jgi:hypothetical protein